MKNTFISAHHLESHSAFSEKKIVTNFLFNGFTQFPNPLKQPNFAKQRSNESFMLMLPPLMPDGYILNVNI